MLGPYISTSQRYTAERNTAKINQINIWFVKENVWIGKINKSKHSDISEKTLMSQQVGILKREYKVIKSRMKNGK